jgi:hypothetical protein
MSLTVTEGTQNTRAARFAQEFTAAVRETPQLVRDAARAAVAQALDAFERQATASQTDPFHGGDRGTLMVRNRDQDCVRVDGVTDAEFSKSAVLSFGYGTSAFPAIEALNAERRSEVRPLILPAVAAALEAEGFRVLGYGDSCAFPFVVITCPPLEQLDQEARAAAEATQFTTTEEGTVIG